MAGSSRKQFILPGNNTGIACASSRGGYTFAELMLALSVIFALCRITVPLINTLTRIHKSTAVYYQDEIGIYQIQLELSLYDIEEVNYDSVVYHKNNDTFIMHIVNDKLMSQPGSEDFIHGISEAVFEVEDMIIYLSFQRDGHWCSYPVGFYAE